MQLAVIASTAATRARRVQPLPAVAFATSFSVLSSAGGTNVPFAIGHPFRQGDVPSAATIGGDVPLQVSVKTTWPDGSVRFAVIAGRKTLSAGVAAAVSLASGGQVAAGASISIADLKATGITASIGCGAFGTVSWTGADWDAPFAVETTGPEMSSWVYRKAVGSDAHLVGWLEVRAFAGGAVEVLPWIENGYLKVASPTNKSATYTFTLGGTQRYSGAIDLPARCRTPLCSGTTYTHWLGADPGLSWAHNTAYLMATRAVPNYVGVTASGNAALSGLVTSFAPLMQGQYSADMSAAGFADAIGLLPNWDALYLTSGGDIRAWRASQAHGYAAGRYQFHHRDEATNLPLRFSQHGTLEIGSGYNIEDRGDDGANKTASSTGTTAPSMDSAHCPAMGYMAYLLTGRRYFREEVQMLSTLLFVKITNTVRNSSAYIIDGSAASTDESRGAAWNLRTLAHAAAISEDGSVLQTEFRTAVNNNIDWYHDRYYGNGDPIGFALGYEDQGEPGFVQRCWMDDFLTGAWGFLRDQAVHSSDRTTKLVQYTEHKYQAIVGRLGPGTAGTFNYRYAAQYDITTAPNNSTDWEGGSGPWYANWGAVATAWGVPSADGGTSLQGGSAGDPTVMATGYWGNLHPAVAYAVDHGAPGAAAAWARMSGASNYAANAAGFNSTPVWGVTPRG